MRSVCLSFLAAALSFFVIPVSYAQPLPSTFQQLLKQNGLRCTIPPGFVSTPVIDNGDVLYDYAVKSRTKKLEIRYRIWPIKDGHEDFAAMLVVMGANISDGQFIQPVAYPPEAVKHEFGADAGCSGLVRAKSDFGKGYKVCVISAIHKDGIADAYTFFLCDDPNVAIEAIATEAVYHSLRFR
jgi:hypothetical protein